MSFRDLERAVRVPNAPTPSKPDRLSSSAKPVVKDAEPKADPVAEVTPPPTAG